MKDYKILLYQRPEKKIITSIVNIATLLTEKWFTPNVPGDIEKDLPFHDALCLFKEGALLSFIVFTSIDGEIQILLMGTHPEHQGKGYGSLLMNHFFHYIKTLGFSRIVALTVPPDTKPAYYSTVEFYEKHGFHLKRRYTELWETGAFELVKDLI
jgi:ribosomal protein S18 acetylase RimI-like enzyme